MRKVSIVIVCILLINATIMVIPDSTITRNISLMPDSTLNQNIYEGEKTSLNVTSPFDPEEYITKYELDFDDEPNLAWIPTKQVMSSPIADAGENQTIYEGENATFNVSGSYDPDGFITKYEFDFGDGINYTWVPTTQVIYGTDILVYVTQAHGAYNRTYFDGDLPQILADEGFKVEVTGTDQIGEITSGLLGNYDQLWVMSTNFSSSGVFSQTEIDAILSFQENGGGLFIAADHTYGGASAATDANQISTNYGVKFSGFINHGHKEIYPFIVSHPLCKNVGSIWGHWSEAEITITNPNIEIIAVNNGYNMIAVLNEQEEGKIVFDTSFVRMEDGGDPNGHDILKGDNVQYAKNIAKWLGERYISELPPMIYHVYGDDGLGTDGIYTMTLTVTDTEGTVNTDICIVMVNNLPPLIEPFGPFIGEEQSPLNFEATGIDLGSDDLTYTWNWGDSSLDTITVYYNDGIGPDPYPSAIGNFPFSETDLVQHIYLSSGIYTINLTVEDDDGGISYRTSFVEIRPLNQVPFADAGRDQNVYEGDIVHFNGSNSTTSVMIKILHISVWQHNELQMIIDHTSSTDKFSITQVGLTEFNAGTPEDLSLFDAVVFGVSNCYEMHSVPIERTTELKDYILNGGGIVWTHDTLEYIFDYGSDIEEPAGVYFDSNYSHFVGLYIPEVEIIMNHEILHNPFDIGNIGDIIPKTSYPPPWNHYDHTSQSNVSTADIIIQHKTTPGSINFYLTTHEYGDGRVVVNELGHSYISEWGNFFSLPSLKECQILVNAMYWVAKGGTTSLNYSWDFDSNIDTDGDGDPLNDMDATGPTPDHIYGDDGRYTVTLTVTNNRAMSDVDTCNITVLNLAPNATIKSATMDVEIGLRVAGRKYNNVSMALYEEGNIIGQVSIERMPGSPNEQMAWIPITLDMTKTYNATVIYIPEDPPNIGSNPVWIYIKFENGSIEKIHHTFNVQQSKKRDSNHWNHVEPWEVDINNHLIGHELSLEVIATDPGSDDLTFQWNSEIVITYYNNGIGPDPYPSPDGIFPFKVQDFIFVPYKGPGLYTLTITDDDNGVTYKTIDLV